MLITRIIKTALVKLGLIEEKKPVVKKVRKVARELTPEEEIARVYHAGKKALAKTGDDSRIYEPKWIPILKEYDRQKSYKIRFEFIPPKQNFRNVRSALQFTYQSFEPWKEIRDWIEQKNDGVCCVCGGVSQDHDEKKTTATECHEVWHYNEQTKVQKLARLMPLCCRCHSIVHLSMHFKDKALTEKLLQDYAEINNVSLDQAYEDLDFAYRERKRRADFEYVLDLKLINKLNLNYEIAERFDPHTQAFLTFIETKFKNSKDLDGE